MVTKAERRWWWKLTLNAISQVLVMHPTLHFCHTTSTVQLEKLTWQKEKEREKGFLILHPKLPSHSQIKIQLTLFSPCRLALKFVFCVEICYDALTLVSLSPNDAEHSKAKRSSFFCFLFFQWRKMSCSRKGVVVQVYTFVTWFCDVKLKCAVWWWMMSICRPSLGQ